MEKYQYHIFSPYRVCPLGAHVDHQHGLVTGFAIDKGVDLYLEYRSGMSMVIGGRRFASYNRTTDLSHLLFMLLGKNDPICGFYYRRGDTGVFFGFPDNELYKVESIYDCADSQLMYDSVNFLISREGHIGLHINTDVAIALKQQIELSMQRRMNAIDLLSGL